MAYFADDALAPEGPVTFAENLWIQDPGILRVGTSAPSDAIINGFKNVTTYPLISNLINVGATFVDPINGTYIDRVKVLAEGSSITTIFDFSDAGVLIASRPQISTEIKSVTYGNLVLEEVVYQPSTNTGYEPFIGPWLGYIKFENSKTYHQQQEIFTAKVVFLNDLLLNTSIDANRIYTRDIRAASIFSPTTYEQLEILIGDLSYFNVGNTTGVMLRVARTVTAGETAMVVWDNNSGLAQRVKVGANGTGPGGVGRALYVNNI